MENKIYKSTINGSIAGGLGYIITLPLDAIKQNAQIGNKNIVNNFHTYFKGGLLGLSSIVPQMAIKFTTNTWIQNNYNINPYIVGFIAGSLDGAFLGPILASQSLQQINNKLTYIQSFKILGNSITNIKLLNLCVPMGLRNGIYTSMIFGTYKLIPNKKNTFIQDLYYTSLINIPATILSCPTDVIRANQIKFLLENKNINFLNVSNQIYKLNGIKGFYQGYRMFYINFAIRFPLTFSLFNYLNSLNNI